MPLGKLSWRETQSRPLRSLLTLFSIIIGVSAIVATSLASNSARLAQEAMVKSVTGNAALEIEGVGATPFDGKPLEFVARIPDVEVASPTIRRFSSMFVVDPAKDSKVKKGSESSPKKDGKEPLPPQDHPPGDPDGEDQESTDSANADAKAADSKNPTKEKPISFRVQLLGIIPELDRKVRKYTVVEGRELSYEDDDRQSVLMDAGFASAANIQVGNQLSLMTRSSRQTATVVGLMKADDASAGVQSGIVIGQLRTIQKWSQANGKLDAIQIVLKENVDPKVTMAAIAAQLPEGVKVREPTMRSQVGRETTVAMQQGLRLATAFSLIISAFIIYNTFQMNVGERRRQLGILRAMGALRKQLLWMIVREGLWLGILGIVAGCIVGNLGAALLNQSTSKLLQITIPPSPWSVWPYVGASAAGLFVAVIGAFFPAMRASQLSPAEAMRVVATGEFGTSRLGWLIFGSVMITAGVIIQFLSVAGLIDMSHAIAGAVVMLIGIVFLLPGVIGELTALVAKILSPVMKTEGRLARRQILRHRGRSSLTIGVVFIAMSTGLGMASTILDHIGNVEGWYQRVIIGDFFIRAAMPDMQSGQSADMPDGLKERIAKMSEVDEVDTLRFVRARSGENTVVVVVREFKSQSQSYFDLIEGEDDGVMAGIKAGKVVLGSVLSQRMGIHLGDKIPLETNDGSAEFEVSGVTNEYIAGGLTLYMDADFARKFLNVEGTDAIVIRSKHGSEKQLEQKLKTLCSESGLMFQSGADLVKIIRDTLNGVVGGLWAVLVLGSIIAAFGLINTLAMNILEQTREIGMLRVVAMTRRQVRRMVLAQALIMGLIGIVPGVATGIWISYLINLTTMQVTGHDVQFRIYPGLLFGGLLFELAVVVIAALIPAERAARINLATALQYE